MFGDPSQNWSGGYSGGGAPGPVQPNYGDIWKEFNVGVLQPSNAAIDNQVNQLGVQLGQQNAQYGLQGQQLQNQLGVGEAQIGIQQGALARQQGLLPQQAALQNQLFDISGQGLGLQKQQAQFQADQSNRSAWSGATARGATNTSGFGQQLSDIGTQLQQRLQGIGLNEKQLGVQKQQYALSEKEQEAQLGDTAKRLGLDSKDLQSRIGIALSQLGLQQSISTMDIANAIADAQNGKFNVLSNVLGQIGQIDPRLLVGAGQSPSQPSVQSPSQTANAPGGGSYLRGGLS